MFHVFLLICLPAWSQKSFTVQDAITVALKSYPTVLSAEKKYENANLQLLKAWLNLAPTASVQLARSTQFTHTHPSDLSSVSQGPNTLDATYGFSIPLFDLSSTFYLADAARVDVRSSAVSKRLVENAVALQAAQAYFGVCLNELKLQYLQRIRALYVQLKAVVQTSQSFASRTDFELQRVMIDPKNPIISRLNGEISQVDGSINLTKQSVEEGKTAIKVVTGLDPKDLKFENTQDTSIRIHLPGSVDEAIRKVLTISPTIELARLNLQAAQAGRKLKFASQYLPKIIFAQSWTSEFSRYGRPYNANVRSNSQLSAFELTWSFQPGAIVSDRIARNDILIAGLDLERTSREVDRLIRDSYTRDATFSLELKRLSELLNGPNGSTVGFEEAIKYIESQQQHNHTLAEVQNEVSLVEGTIQILTSTFLEILTNVTGYVTNRIQILATLGEFSRNQSLVIEQNPQKNPSRKRSLDVGN